MTDRDMGPPSTHKMKVYAQMFATMCHGNPVVKITDADGSVEVMPVDVMKDAFGCAAACIAACLHMIGERPGTIWNGDGKKNE